MKYILLVLCSEVFFICNYSINSQVIDWYGSAIYEDSPFKPGKDTLGHTWHDYSFDDNSWSSITKLPDKNWGCTDCDRYYRGHINLEASDLNNFNYFINFQSDDGIWIYINGRLLGHWGGEMHKGPAVNSPIWGGDHVEPVYIGDKLQEGKNVIAVHVSNGPIDSYFNLDLSTNTKRK